jgi:hypothetical protein
MWLTNERVWGTAGDGERLNFSLVPGSLDGRYQSRINTRRKRTGAHAVNVTLRASLDSVVLIPYPPGHIEKL